MPPRLPTSLYSIRTLRLHLLPRRTLFTTRSIPAPSSYGTLSTSLIAGTLLLSTGLYALSRPTAAEVQSTKTQPQNENRELTASASRKAAEHPGKAEKQGHSEGGSSQDRQPERRTAEKKPESGADEESKTGKFKGGHDESGQPRDERLRSKSGKVGKEEKHEGKEDKKQEKDDKQGKKDDAKDMKDEKKESKDDEEEEDQGPQAFDPETGEINWDCPCLGDMPHGPCGQEFRAAFSCFVHSQEDPKGQDCIDAFAAMQDCFRYSSHPEVTDQSAHPEVYKPMDALDDDDLDETSSEALETATQKGDQKLDSKDSKDTEKTKREEKDDDAIPTTDVKPIAKGSQGGKKPKQGDEGKNENLVARSG